MRRATGFMCFGLALAGCGGSDKRPEPEASGVFEAGGAIGVHYATATRSGETDSAGTFKYLPGESVTFSLGAIELGSVPGAAAITPFTLAGVTPPTTEYALRRELDRATRNGTRFGRAINIQRLLMALDADHNPANGLSVGTQVGALANAEIDLGLRVSAFAGILNKRVPNLTGNLPNSQPLVFLYRALGISVPVHAEARAETTFVGIVGLPARVNFATYTPQGARASEGVDLDDDGNAELENGRTYDSLGRVTSMSTRYAPGILSSPMTMMFTYEYDERGYLLGGNEDRDLDADGLLEYRVRHDLTNDSHGFAITEVADTDVGVDGIVDSRVSFNNTFDSRHNFTAGVTESDHELDSIADERQTVDATYDARDRILKVTYRFDDDANGVADSRFSTSYEYGSGPGATGAVDEQDYENDGIVDLRAVTTTAYVGGNVDSTLYEYDGEADGTFEYRQRRTFTYDAEQRLISEDDFVDYDGDRIFDQLVRITHHFDDIGSPLTSIYEFDLSNDGQVDAASKQTYSYGSSGERLSMSTGTRGQGGVDYVPRDNTQFTNLDIIDGIQTLAQQFLDFGGLAAGGYVSVSN